MEITVSAPFADSFLFLFLASLIVYLSTFIIDLIFSRAFKYTLSRLIFGLIMAVLAAVSFFIIVVLVQGEEIKKSTVK